MAGDWNEQSGVAAVDNFAIPDWMKKLVGGAALPAPTPAATPPVTLGGSTPPVKSSEMSTTPIKPPPVSYASQAAQLQGQEPTRGQFPVQQQPAWKKLLGGVLSTAAGVRDPNVAGATARDFYGAPKQQAEDEYNQAHQAWVGKMAQIANQANLAGKDQENAFRAEETRKVGLEADALQNKPETPTDKKIDEYVNDQQQRVLTFQRADGTTYDKAGGKVFEKPANDPAQKSTKEQLQAQIAAADAKGDQATVKALQGRLKAIDPEGQQRMNITIAGQQAAAARGDATAARAEANATRQEVREHDKNYVLPAEGVEKSYQMMDSAYKEYKAAKAAGKDLPTGAQSMLALSTHLSTTFGNVKGSRVTKDMIQEHLGARSISDSALVAFQKLTNGDQLSPAQWDAFHDLISQSRAESWRIAAKEANRKQIPVDFLPKDLDSLKGGDAPAASGTGGIKIIRDANGRITGVQ